QICLDLVLPWARRRLEDEAHGVVDEDPRRLPRIVARDATAFRIGRARVDAGGAQRELVDPERVPVRARQRDRMVREGGAQGRRRGQPLPPPQVLRPAAAADPGSPRGALRRLGGTLGALLFGTGSRATDLGARPPVESDVAVRIREAGNRASAFQIEQPDVLPRQPFALLARADGGEAAVAHERRLRSWPGGIRRMEGAEHEQLAHRRPCLRAFRAASTPALCSREMGASPSRLETKLLAVLLASFVAGILFWHTWPL